MRLTRTELLVAIVVMAVAFVAGGLLRRAQPPGTPDQAQQLRALVKPGDLLMLSSTTCPYCVRAREWLTAEGIPFGECFIETDRACAQRYVRAGAQATPTVLVGGRPVLGLDPARMLQLLETERP